MRHTLWMMAAVAALGIGGSAHAQFANKSLGLSGGFMDLAGSEAAFYPPSRWYAAVIRENR